MLSAQTDCLKPVWGDSSGSQRVGLLPLISENGVLAVLAVLAKGWYENESSKLFLLEDMKSINHLSIGLFEG
jgi:hypothetical protein